jgi:hypothetical protein
MNNLSWLIYLAYVVDTFSAFVGWLMFPCFIAIVASGIGIMYCLDTTDGKGKRLDENLIEGKRRVDLPMFKKWCLRFCTMFVVLGVIFSLTPNRQTVLLVAASEIGERSLNSEAMAKVSDRLGNVIDPSIDLLNTWIRKQTSDLRRSMEPPVQNNTTTTK